ncbi:MAG: helix-turn-helix domain-containing protein [Candidatus Caenarcaniphilales bacterium]|nr:helix-turn-helix domain-containing protein [Candidatus Caenarcaniphilales bacterium]
MKDCPKCTSKRMVKNGFTRGLQRYLCKDCGFNPTVENIGYPPEIRAKALQMYLEGVSIRAISRIMKLGIATIISWIKKASQELPVQEQPKKVTLMEMDELHHWIGEKKRSSGFGLQFAVVQVESYPGKWVVVER